MLGSTAVHIYVHESSARFVIVSISVTRTMAKTMVMRTRPKMPVRASFFIAGSRTFHKIVNGIDITGTG